MKILKKVGFLSLFPILLLAALIIASIASFQESKVFVLKKKAEEEQHADVSTALSGIPSFITDEMIIGALSTQAQYGYPASVHKSSANPDLVDMVLVANPVKVYPNLPTYTKISLGLKELVRQAVSIW